MCKGCIRLVTAQHCYRVKMLDRTDFTLFCKKACYDIYMENEEERYDDLGEELSEEEEEAEEESCQYSRNRYSHQTFK